MRCGAQEPPPFVLAGAKLFSVVLSFLWNGVTLSRGTQKDGPLRLSLWQPEIKTAGMFVRVVDRVPKVFTLVI